MCAGDAEASGQESKVNSKSVQRKYGGGLVLDLIEDGKLSRPCINANLIELMMAAVDTVSKEF